MKKHLEEGEARALASRQDTDALLDVVAAKEEGAEEIADLGQQPGGAEGFGLLLDRPVPGHALGGVLREIGGLHARAEADLTPIVAVDAGEDAHEGRLAGAVGADEGDLHPPLDLEVQALDDAMRAIGLMQAVDLDGGLPRVGGRRECEVYPLHALRYRDRHDLLELLHPAL